MTETNLQFKFDDDTYKDMEAFIKKNNVIDDDDFASYARNFLKSMENFINILPSRFYFSDDDYIGSAFDEMIKCLFYVETDNKIKDGDDFCELLNIMKSCKIDKFLRKKHNDEDDD